ncbi:MAG: hypothetical protein ACFBSG_06915 [Leptolyngbyaceae cyanobacterium]
MAVPGITRIAPIDMQLDELTPESVPDLELDTAVPIMYYMTNNGAITQKVILRK